MTFFINHITDYKRLMFGVISDSRQNIPAILNKRGDVIKTYVDSQIALVVPGVIMYSLTTDLGALAGYFGFQTVPGSVSVVLQQYRPAFAPFTTDISQAVNNFITSGNWRFNTLN